MHNQFKRVSHIANLSNQARKASQRCHQHFWQYAKELLDDNATNQTSPSLEKMWPLTTSRKSTTPPPTSSASQIGLPTPRRQQKSYPVMRLTLVSCRLPSNTPNPHSAPPLTTRFPIALSPGPFQILSRSRGEKSGPPQPAHLLLVPSCDPTRVEACSSQIGWEELSCRRSHKPSQFPAHCACLLCWQAIHHHNKDPMAQLHDVQWLSQQLHPES